MKKKALYIIIPLIVFVVGFNLFKSGKPAQQSSSSCILSAKEFVDADKSDIIIVDVRTPNEFASGHIQNAVDIDINSRNFKDEMNKLDKNKTYYVYCKSGIRSRSAVGYMTQSGFKNVCDVDGGLNNLARAGAKLVK